MTRLLLSATVLAALTPASLAAAASPTATIGVAASTKSGHALQVTPESGALPFRATFTLKAPKAVSWRLDFGDGRSETAKGTPPASVNHTYAHGGTYRAYVIFTDKGTASYIRYSVPAGGLPVPVP